MTNLIRFVGIDPSTFTGFVALDFDGNVIESKVIEGIGKEDPKRMFTMIDRIRDELRKTDVIAIEGFPYASKQAIQLGGIGWAIRGVLYRSKVDYLDVAPNALKKRVGVTGWEGEKGKKSRLTKDQRKKAVMDGALREFGRFFENDNINDAFVLAHMARENYMKEVKW
jgi:crossover junction endodeoxyribonuclease RuvC